MITFGTDGWRGMIADDFTFDNVRRVAAAIASYVLKHEDPQHGVIIGYDTRFASPRAARATAEVLAGAGIPVKLTNDYTPTPAVSLAVRDQKAAGGVVITSSHNPWNWNGVKFKAKFGGSATPAIMKILEEELAAGSDAQGPRRSDCGTRPEARLHRSDLPLRRCESDRQSQVQLRGGFDARRRARRAGHDLQRPQHSAHCHSPGTEPAVPGHQS